MTGIKLLPDSFLDVPTNRRATEFPAMLRSAYHCCNRLVDYGSSCDLHSFDACNGCRRLA